MELYRSGADPRAAYPETHYFICRIDFIEEASKLFITRTILASGKRMLDYG
jgi:hypothetical protein